MADIEKQNSLIPLSQAVETIKTAILQGQYEAVKGVNRIQLAVYFSIGKYLSENTHHFAYGSAALKVISEQLRKELPGIRGYSETQLKEMRKFYDEWIFLDAKKSVATDKCATKKKSVATDNSQSTIAMAKSSQESSVATDESLITKSSVVTDELQVADNKIEITDLFAYIKKM